EHRVEVAVATSEAEPENEPENENDQQVPSGGVAATTVATTAPASIGASAVSAPVAATQLETEALDDRSQGARIEEIFAPGPIFTEELPHTTEQTASRIVARAAPTAPQTPSVPNTAPVRVMARRYAPQSIRPAASAQKPPEPNPAPSAGTSFSAVPSISQWAAKGSPAPRIPARSNPLQSGAPLFPPRGSENIFARNRWDPAEFKERHTARNLLMIVLLLLVLGGVLLAVAYQNGYREQIGAVIQHIGNTVAGGSDS